MIVIFAGGCAFVFSLCVLFILNFPVPSLAETITIPSWNSQPHTDTRTRAYRTDRKIHMPLIIIEIEIYLVLKLCECETMNFTKYYTAHMSETCESGMERLTRNVIGQMAKFCKKVRNNVTRDTWTWGKNEVRVKTSFIPHVGFRARTSQHTTKENKSWVGYIYHVAYGVCNI